MNKLELLTIHQQQVANNDEHTDKLVSILGGIDNILTLVLSCDDIKLESEQISQIHKVITHQPTIQQDSLVHKQNKHNSNKIELKMENNKPKCTYYFNKNNTFLHSLVDKQIAQRIIHVLYSKYFVIATLIIYGILWWSFTENSFTFQLEQCGSAAKIWYFIFSEIYFNVAVILMILTVNKNAFYLVIRLFEFWFKLYEAIQFVFWWYVFRYAVLNVSASTINITSDIILTLRTFMIMILASLFDGFYIGYIYKIWLSVIISSSIAVFAVYFSFYFKVQNTNEFDEYEDDSLIELNIAGMAVSVRSMLGGSLKILAIFYWKQTISSIWKRKREKCADIKAPSPYIKWIDDTDINEEQQTEMLTNTDQAVSGDEVVNLL